MEACEVSIKATEGQASGLFPHRVIRGGQEQFLEDARMCMAQRTHLFAHAPTGLGKTAVSLTAAVETALPSQGLVLFLTSRQSQHAIAIETLRRMCEKRKIGVVDLISREDMCPARRDGGVPCSGGRSCYLSRDVPSDKASHLLDRPLHVQEAAGGCLREGLCPHQAAMQAAAEATVVVADYNQMFGRGPNIVERLDRREKETILIVDEAHNLPSRVMGNASGSVNMAMLERVRNSPMLRHFAEDIDILKEQFVRLAGRRPERIGADELDGPLKRCCGVDTSGLAEEIEGALLANGSGRSELVEFLHTWSEYGESSIRYVDGDPPNLKVSLIDPSLITAPVLSRVRCALVMSGTLHPPEMFADLLGAERSMCRRYPSPFPPENKLIVARGGVSSRFRLRSAPMYRAVASQISEAAGRIPGNVAVFFPSYEFMGQVEKLLLGQVLGKKLIVERRDVSKGEKGAVLDRLAEEESLLLGCINGSFSEGIDFRDNLLSGVIVIGLPLSPPSREMEAMLARMERKFGPRKANLYVQIGPAISKVLQAAGRAIRGEKDRAAILLMDDRYLLAALRASFPDDFNIVRTADLAGALTEFFTNPVPDADAGELANAGSNKVI
jgi:DNA excision repair protein ERCC-2